MTEYNVFSNLERLQPNVQILNNTKLKYMKE